MEEAAVGLREDHEGLRLTARTTYLKPGHFIPEPHGFIIEFIPLVQFAVRCDKQRERGSVLPPYTGPPCGRTRLV